MAEVKINRVDVAYALLQALIAVKLISKPSWDDQDESFKEIDALLNVRNGLREKEIPADLVEVVISHTSRDLMSQLEQLNGP